MSRVTKQKRLMGEEIATYTSFFDAEDIYHQVLKKNPGVGIATVYRFLHHLTQTGKIHSYSCNRKTLYSNSKKNHCHFTCEKCGVRTHLDIKKIDFLSHHVAGDICHFQIDITGRCEKCVV